MDDLGKLLKTANETIEDKDVIALARELIAIPSQSKSEHQIADYIFKKLEKWGLRPKKIPVDGYGPDVVAEIGNLRAQRVILSGHMDTVEVMEGWKHDPYGGKIEKGMLYGLGSLDMKSGLAGMMVALRAVSEAGIPRSSRVVFQAVTGEEENSAGVRTLLAKGAFRRAKAVIVGEGFGGLAAITHGRRGGYYWEINLRGKASHGASPHLGVNSVSEGAKIVRALDSMELRSSPELFADDSTPLREDQTVLKMSGGMEMRSLSVPDKCYIKFIRCPIPGSPRPEEVTAEIKRTITALKLRSKVKLSLETGPGDIFHPFITSANSKLVQAASECMARITGRKPKLVIGRSEADDNLIAREGNIQVIDFGPGETGALVKYHQAEEAVHVDQLGDAARAYFMTAMRLCR